MQRIKPNQGGSGIGASGYSGYSGLHGSSASSGYSGLEGISGYSGYGGIVGISGYSGMVGTSGYSGIEGVSGYSGTSFSIPITNKIYVDGQRTDPYTPDGSIIRPYKTIQSAINAVTGAAYGRINLTIFSGNYNEQVTLKQFVNLCGEGIDGVYIQFDTGDTVIGPATSDSSLSNLNIMCNSDNILHTALRVQNGSIVTVGNLNLMALRTSLIVENGAFFADNGGSGCMSGEADCVVIKNGGFAAFNNYVFSGWGNPYYDLTVEAGGEVQLTADCFFYNERTNILGTVTYRGKCSKLGNDSSVTGTTVKDALETLKSNGATINPQTDTTYQLVLTDAGKIVTLTNASPIAVTIPTNAVVAFPVGTRTDLIQGGAGKVTFSGAGVTIKSKSSNKSIGAQNVGVSLIKEATDTWYLIGDLIA